MRRARRLGAPRDGQGADIGEQECLGVIVCGGAGMDCITNNLAVRL